ncbi:MAG: hypothetical protein KJN64_11155 [Ignavibacteria bacterium]|nr:hypothetical protein [Ignavibacteria bacterium]MBT8380779.1 hypothetical protein [Ignavibacteria bacterium]MBT8392872.1 hypothetical protein [Ignavibacteria bacterium]NNJ53228.1 hypothetical protein [Ignavibacteriaceae bacterium]NNL19712.1 hypothetical protein [Ignavibacteriaceae bacterium]
MNISEREIIDSLVNEFWRLGYFTLSRRMGKYLPEPTAIGNFKVDVVGRQRDKYAVGIILNLNDLNDLNLIEKIKYLASRHSKSSRKPVTLLVGVPEYYHKLAKQKISSLDGELKRNVKIVKITENRNAHLHQNKHTEVLFS